VSTKTGEDHNCTTVQPTPNTFPTPAVAPDVNPEANAFFNENELNAPIAPAVFIVATTAIAT
jgi:hypothetical protein